MDNSPRFFQKIFLKLPVIGFDLCTIPIAWLLAYFVQTNVETFTQFFGSTEGIEVLSILITVQMALYYFFRVYRGLWRYSSLNDVLRILRAVSFCALIAFPLFHLLSFNQRIPEMTYPLYAIFLISLLCGGRLLLRYSWSSRYNDTTVLERKRVLIVGAGQAGESLLRDLKRVNTYTPVGVLDDNRSKCGLELHGVRVIGTISQLSELAFQYAADLIFIAIPSVNSAEMRRIVRFCEESKIPFHTLPSLQDLVAGRVEVNALRKVNIADLLGRDQVTLAWEHIAARITGRRILVTGGGGSIGSELCRQIAALNPTSLLIIDNNEFNLYEIERELVSQFPLVEIKPVLLSVVDGSAVKETFKQFQPQIVFHAAAYKHVPMLEHQVRVAVRNNIIGTQIVAEASIAVNVEAFVLISTDKAVNPTSVMGATKRVAEIYCQNLNLRAETQFITVRFGNVLGSVGSVIPLFQKQIEAGGPLTVTHPDIQRYFMTIPEASQLILQALATGEGGEIFVLDMGEPIKISYLAEQLIRLSGKEPGKDIKIQYVGLRQGEKLFEELFHTSEQLVPTTHEKLYKARFRTVDWHELIQTLRMMNSACSMHQQAELLILLKSLVPEFKHDILESTV